VLYFQCAQDHPTKYRNVLPAEPPQSLQTAKPYNDCPVSHPNFPRAAFVHLLCYKASDIEIKAASFFIKAHFVAQQNNVSVSELR
jgi:hypothetical protein